MSKIQYSTIEQVKLSRLESDLQIHTNPTMIEGFKRKSYFGKGSADLDVKEGGREFIAKITTNMRDRDNEIVLTGGIDLKYYKSNPVILWSHNYLEPPIGKAKWIKTYTEDNK